MIALKKILVPTDFSDMSLYALKYAQSFAESYSAQLKLLHVVDEASLYWMAMGLNSIPMGPSGDELVEIAQKLLPNLQVEMIPGQAPRSAKQPMVITKAKDVLGWTPEFDMEAGFRTRNGRQFAFLAAA